MRNAKIPPPEIPIDPYYWCAGHVVILKGAGNQIPKSIKSRNDRNFIAESKGVPGDRESEGSRRQMERITTYPGRPLRVPGNWIGYQETGRRQT